MTVKDDGGPAFPTSVAEILGIATNSAEFGMPGMSLRDYFAGQVLIGMHARDTADPGTSTPEKRARLAYLDADVMLLERSKP